MILSNGVASPVFNVSNLNVQSMQSVNVSDFSLVKRVNGTKDYNTLSCLIFSKKDGTLIAKVEKSSGKPYGSESVIGDSEEIIGIYGH